jgi:hypothetical protein
MNRTLARITAVSLALCLFAAGCSDDIVCPEAGQTDVLPHVTASVSQGIDARAEWAHAEVVCSADPLPSLLIAFINGREISGIETSGELGVVRTLDDDVVIWQPGARCSLEVTSDYGYATAAVTAPGATEVVTDAMISKGDTLRLSWGAADGADYYSVTAVYTEEGGGSSLAILHTTRDTTAEFTTDSVTPPGEFTGLVESVAGPYPEGGTEGNVSGDGWGFFTMEYSDTGSAFVVAVSD